jgi:AAA+ superfamily predicted ATPase
MNNTATVMNNAIPVKYVNNDNGVSWITVDAPNGWDDVKKICKKVLVFDGKPHKFTGWNSDRNVAFFKQSNQYAVIS